MMDSQLGQIAVGLVVALTPWCVVRIVLAVAQHHAQSVQVTVTRPASLGLLGRLTALALPLVAVPAAWMPAPSFWMGVVSLVIFAALSAVAMRPLGDIVTQSQPANEASASVRVASLRPRRLRESVPPVWRIGLFCLAGGGLALFAWRLMEPVAAANRRLLLPVLFAISAAVFCWLYEVWLRDLTTGGHTPEDPGSESHRHRTARAVFAAEAVLVMSCLVVAHALLNLDWIQQASWGIAGALIGGSVGIVGCALALSSDLVRRRYRPV